MEEIVAMGLMDLVKKAFLGASDEDNRKNRARVRDTFNSCVQMAIQFVPVMYKQTISRVATLGSHYSIQRRNLRI